MTFNGICTVSKVKSFWNAIYSACAVELGDSYCEADVAYLPCRARFDHGLKSAHRARRSSLGRPFELHRGTGSDRRGPLVAASAIRRAAWSRSSHPGHRAWSSERPFGGITGLGLGAFRGPRMVN